MKVILREDIEGVGNIGDILEVARGYARNYLFPRHKAVQATSRNLKTVEHAKRVIAEKARKEKIQIEEYAKKVGAIALTIPVKVGKDDRLFGSVTAKDIAEALAAQGIEVDRRKIQLEHPIKELGMTTVGVRLHSQVMAQINVTVAKAEAETEPVSSAQEG